MAPLPRAGRLAAFLGLVAGAGLLHAAPASAQDVEVTPVVIADADGHAIEGGGSATAFSFRLPDGAACQGDSRDEDYRVNSYMVPGSVDPEDVTYDGLGPTPQAMGDPATFRHPLYDVETTFFVSIQTQDADAPGAPGIIRELPGFDLDVFAPGDVPPGRYHVGIACTLLNEVTRVWDAEIEVVADPTDEPAGIRWTAVGFEPDADPRSPLPIVLGVGLAVVALAIVRTRRRTPTIPQRSTP